MKSATDEISPKRNFEKKWPPDGPYNTVDQPTYHFDVAPPGSGITKVEIKMEDDGAGIERVRYREYLKYPDGEWYPYYTRIIIQDPFTGNPIYHECFHGNK